MLRGGGRGVLILAVIYCTYKKDLQSVEQSRNENSYSLTNLTAFELSKIYCHGDKNVCGCVCVCGGGGGAIALLR